MKILFYTRLEGNTGGDETFLHTLKFYLLKNLTSGTEVNLCLSYDLVSEARAVRITREWQDTLADKNLTGQVFLFLTGERSLEKSVSPVKYRYIDLGTNSIEKKRTDTLDESVTWYIKSQGQYFVRPKKNEIIPLQVQDNGDVSEIDLKEKKCYVALEKAEQSTMYPLFVLKDLKDIKELEDIKNLNHLKEKKIDLNKIDLKDKAIFYYADDDSSAKKFPLASLSKSLLQLKFRIDKSGGKAVLLSEGELQTITSLATYIPEDLLITESEYQTIKQNLKTPLSLETERTHWLNFKQSIASLDLFVMAGWAHLQSPVTAKYLKEELKLPLNCKILVSCVPGMSINVFGFVTGLKEEPSYKNLYVMQPGIGTKGGFPLLPSLTKEGIERQQVRDAWLRYVSMLEVANQEVANQEVANYKQYMNDKGEARQDKLIVIYCSKDGIGESGTRFLQNISKQIKEENRANYYVLLIGSDPNSAAYKGWALECKLRHFKCRALPRTENTENISGTEILMRGLRDAEFSMATGSYSILEARYLGIDHCVYLSPPHMRQLGNMLEQASIESIKHAFEQGRRALDELCQLPFPEYKGNLFNSDLAWNKGDSSEWIACWEKYLEEAQQQDDSSNREIISYKP